VSSRRVTLVEWKSNFCCILWLWLNSCNEKSIVVNLVAIFFYMILFYIFIDAKNWLLIRKKCVLLGIFFWCRLYWCILPMHTWHLFKTKSMGVCEIVSRLSNGCNFIVGLVYRYLLRVRTVSWTCWSGVSSFILFLLLKWLLFLKKIIFRPRVKLVWFWRRFFKKFSCKLSPSYQYLEVVNLPQLLSHEWVIYSDN